MANCEGTFPGTDAFKTQASLNDRGLRSRQHINENTSKKKKKRHQKKKSKVIKQKQKKQLFNKSFTKSAFLNKKSLPQQTFNNNINMACNQWAQSYTNAMVWQYKHQIAYWKSKAVSLEYENKVLHDIIKSLYTQKNPSGHSHINEQTAREAKTQNDFYYNEVNDDEELSGEDSTYEDEQPSSGEEAVEGMEISEAFMSFLEQNMKHKLELQEERKKRKESESESDIIKKMEEPPCEKVAEQREAEMKMLYGESSNIVIGLESAVQLNFDRYMDVCKPIYWPNIPLKL